MKVSGTDAKTVALHFLNATTDGRNTPAVIAKTIAQAKNLLSVGYTVDEICASIDHITKKGIHMYSFGYLNTCMADVLKEVNAEHLKREMEQTRQEMAAQLEQMQGEVKGNVESTERNRLKARRIGLQSGEREKR